MTMIIESKNSWIKRDVSPDGASTLLSDPWSEVVFVMIGDGARQGAIKTVPFSRHKKSSLLTVEAVPGRGYDVAVKAEFRHRGFRLVKELYQAEGREKDYERLVEFMKHAKASGRSIIKHKYKDCVLPGFPDSLLPKKCLELAADRGRSGAVYDPDVYLEEDAAETEPEPKRSSKRA
jgi:hypothetical protein